LQVAAKYMPKASIKIGVDLGPIKAIRGCVTFQCDITTQKCLKLIKKELKHFQCDVVMNDGAPNVSTNWNLDAFQQVELTLHSVAFGKESSPQRWYLCDKGVQIKRLQFTFVCAQLIVQQSLSF